MKKIAVLNDISGLGKCSLTAAIPVISVMGVQAVPLPTAVLSAQTGFPSYYYIDNTAHMAPIMQEWKKMGLCPDGIYTGFLSGAAQAELVLEFIDLFGTRDTGIVVDPVMGDNGEEYPIYTEELCDCMRRLAKKATRITPNLTEALLLLYGRGRMHEIWKKIKTTDDKNAVTADWKKDETFHSKICRNSSEILQEKYEERENLKKNIEEIGKKLCMEFDTETVITGIDLVSSEGISQVANLICTPKGCSWVTATKCGGSYSGTGDLFASVLAAGMVNGEEITDSVHRAVNFLSKAIQDTVKEGTDRNEGVCFEKYLRDL